MIELNGQQPQKTLPKDWRLVRVAEIGPVTDGDWILNADYSPSGVRLLQVGDVGVGRFIGKSSRFISPDRANELGCTLLKAGDILISRMPDPIGRGCQLPELGYPSITAVDVSIWRPNDEIADRQYLTHFLNSPDWLTRVQSLASGATRARISRKNLELIPIALPPLGEQKRIASILTEQIATVEKARAATEVQLQAAKALPAAYLRDVFESVEAKQWPLYKVSDLCNRIDYGFTASADHTMKEPRFLRITDIQNGRVNWDTVPGCHISDSEAAANRLLDGDIVFARTGATTGKSFLIKKPPDAVFASYLIRLQPKDNILPPFMYAYFQSDGYWRQIRLNARGGAQPNVNASLLGNITIPLPPLSAQAKVVSNYATQMEAIETVQDSLQWQLTSIEKLPTALLKQAFNGEI